MAVSPSTVVRADLVGLIEQELLGPRNGPEEEIKGTPRAAYALGGLAPVTVDPSAVSTSSTDAAASRPMPAPTRTATGLGVADIDPATPALSAGCRWRTDEEPGSADDDEAARRGSEGCADPSVVDGPPVPGAPRLRRPDRHRVLGAVRGVPARRTRRGGRSSGPSAPVREDSRDRRPRHRLAHVALDPIDLDADVTLRVELFPLRDRMIVELALSNDRVTGMDAPPGDWLFQTKMKVEANSGEAVFLPTP